MITWERSFTYFLKRSAKNGTSFHTEIELFAKEYNCTIVAIDTIECKEEDFLVIQLACPEAVRCKKK